MIESVYITLIILGFVFLPAGFFIRSEEVKTTEGAIHSSPKFMQQIVLFAISAILFGALAAASFNLEIVSCISTSCTSNSFVFEDNAYIFGFFALIAGILTLIKSFDAFYFAKGKL